MNRRQFRAWSVVAVVAMSHAPPSWCRRCLAREAMIPGALQAAAEVEGPVVAEGAVTCSSRPRCCPSANLSPGDFPTMRSTTGNVYVWEDVHALGFLTNNLIVITSDGVLVADGQNSPEATKKMVDAIGLLTPQPIKYVVVCSEHGDHTGRKRSLPFDSHLHLEPGLPGQPRPAGQGPEHQRPEDDRAHRHGGRSARAEDG